MLSRRAFLRNSALVTAGVIAADQLEILDRLAPRSLFSGADFNPRAYIQSCYGISGGFQIGDNVALVRSGTETALASVVSLSPLSLRFNTPRQFRSDDYLIHANPEWVDLV